jgi:hypothetical protein
MHSWHAQYLVRTYPKSPQPLSQESYQREAGIVADLKAFFSV